MCTHDCNQGRNCTCVPQKPREPLFDINRILGRRLVEAERKQKQPAQNEKGTQR